MTYIQPDLPDENVTEVELDGVGYDLVRELNVCDDAIEKWQERRKAAHDQLLKLVTGDDRAPKHYTATHGGRGVAYVTVYAERRFNSRAFQSDHPVLHDSYRQESIRTRLTTDKTVR